MESLPTARRSISLIELCGTAGLLTGAGLGFAIAKWALGDTYEALQGFLIFALAIGGIVVGHILGGRLMSGPKPRGQDKLDS